MPTDDESERGTPILARRCAAEGLGTAFLLAAIVGSGIIANTLATGAALVALILTFGPVSGAHFNPAVTLAVACESGLAWTDVPAYLAGQIVGAFAGVGIADLMFDLPAFSPSQHARHGPAQLLSEFVATFGLLTVIWATSRLRSATTVPFAVGAYITAAYWFTASTSFANPAVTVARAASDTFAGISPYDVPGFVVAQLLGAGGATALMAWLVPSLPRVARRVIARGIERAPARGARS